MRICVDVRCLTEGRRTGVEEYALGLLLALFELDKDNEYILFFSSWKKPDFDFTIFEKYKNVKLKRIRIPNKILNLFFWYLNWPKIDRLVGGSDVIFFPNIIFSAVSLDVRVITTIHDLSFERYEKYFSWKRRFWHAFVNPRKICKRADEIIAVSKSSANDLVSLYGISTKKITTIPSAVSDKFSPVSRNDENLLKVKEKYNLPFKFILYLGTIEPRKNILNIIKAYNCLQKMANKKKNDEISKYKLVIAGSSGWLSEEIFKEITKSKFKDKIILTGFVEDKDKVYVYNLASLFVYPSFFEGFGFPVLEAMACGVPVVASNNSSLPEVCGDSALLIDPNNADDIYIAMWQILSDKVLMDRLGDSGLTLAKKFSWEESARQTLKLISKK